ncbi:MAG: response regulator [Desulfobacterium sp.]|nr:response regulator [Desulfobacterium sp.]
MGRILLVEDEPAVRAVTSLMLQRLGWDVITAATGKEALRILASDPIDIQIAVLDLHLPDMGGETLFGHLRLLEMIIPVVFCSGYDRDDPTVHSLTAESQTAFIQKPFGINTLESALIRLKQTSCVSR